MRIGVIGTGWGRMHVGGFRAAGAEVYALCGADLQKTRRVAEAEGIPLATDDVRTLCQSVDAVVVASPDAWHARHAHIALEAGRAVLCEKPLTPGVAEARELVQAARVRGLTCATNFPYRMLPPLAALRRWLGERRLQTVVVTVRNGFASGAGVAGSGDFGGASHVIDAALWLSAGPARWVHAALIGQPPHSVALQMSTETGVAITLSHLASPEPGIHGGWTFIGDGWEAGFSAAFLPARNGWCVSPVRAYEEGAWFDVHPGVEPRSGEPEPWAQAHIETARAFLAAMAGRPHPDLATFTSGLDVQEVIDAADRSAAVGARVAVARSTC